jgi:MFS family permease
MFGTLLPFYLVGVLNLGSHEESGISFNIALVPLICYFSSVLAASKLTWFYANVGRKKALMIGTIICLLSMLVLYILIVDFAWVIYFVAIFIGISQAMVLGTGINLISEVVGEKGSKGAFVFGIYSFCDKITVGVIIYLVSNT